MDKKGYLVGTQSEVWKLGAAQQVTFIVTADCNLRCKYCYITHKSGGKDEAELLEQITRERDITNEKYNAWWDSIRENYDFEGDEQGHWRLDFQTGEVFLVV